MSTKSLHRMVEGALIAALYTALTLLLQPIAFGPFQCRVSELLTLLPVFTPAAIPGLALGCAISNAVGVATGANIAGVLDIPLGTLATLLAALCTYALRNVRVKNIPVLAALPPVIFNALIIGGELSYGLNIPFWLAALVEVGLGEFAACVVLGLPFVYLLQKSGASARIFGTNPSVSGKG